jgi:GTP:adenosylcobinamide-phosphate guanylyltransferase
VKAVILAGGRAAPGLARVAGTDRKPLIEFGGKPSLWYVLQALSQSGCIEQICVVGSEGCHGIAEEHHAIFRPEGSGAIENMLSAIDALGLRGTGERVLVLAADTPLVRAEDISRFVSACPADAGMASAFVARERVEREQPSAPYHYIRVREGRFASTGIFILRASTAETMAERMRRAHQSRKSQLLVAIQLGPLNLLLLALGILPIERAKRAIERIAGDTAWGDLDASPRLSLDIDTPADYLYIRDNWEHLATAIRR